MALTLGRLFEGVEGGRHLFDILAGEELVRAFALLLVKTVCILKRIAIEVILPLVHSACRQRKLTLPCPPIPLLYQSE